MELTNPGAGSGRARAVGLLLRPNTAWDEIAARPAAPRTLLMRYAAPLAAAPAVCGVVGVLVFGFNIANVGVQMNPTGLVLAALVNYGLTLAALCVLAVFIDYVAPAFAGLRGRTAAFNLVVYAATASWIGGVSEIYPALGIPVGILAGLYSLYALYLGLPKLMQVPEDRVLTAYATVLVAILVLVVGRGILTAKAAEIGGPLSASYAPR